MNLAASLKADPLQLGTDFVNGVHEINKQGNVGLGKLGQVVIVDVGRKEDMRDIATERFQGLNGIVLGLQKVDCDKVDPGIYPKALGRGSG